MGFGTTPNKKARTCTCTSMGKFDSPGPTFTRSAFVSPLPLGSPCVFLSFPAHTIAFVIFFTGGMAVAGLAVVVAVAIATDGAALVLVLVL